MAKKYIAGNKKTADIMMYIGGAMDPVKAYQYSQGIKKRALKAGKSWITITK